MASLSTATEETVLAGEIFKHLRNHRAEINLKLARGTFKQRMARGHTVMFSLLAAVATSRVSAEAKVADDALVLPTVNSMEELLAKSELCIPEVNISGANEEGHDHHGASIYARHGSGHDDPFASPFLNPYARSHDQHSDHKDVSFGGHDSHGRGAYYMGHETASGDHQNHSMGHASHTTHQSHHASGEGQHHVMNVGHEQNAPSSGDMVDHKVEHHTGHAADHSGAHKGGEHSADHTAHQNHGGANTPKDAVQSASDGNEEDLSVSNASAHEHEGHAVEKPNEATLQDGVSGPAMVAIADLENAQPEAAAETAVPQSDSDHTHHDHGAIFSLNDLSAPEDLSGSIQPDVL